MTCCRASRRRRRHWPARRLTSRSAPRLVRTNTSASSRSWASWATSASRRSSSCPSGWKRCSTSSAARRAVGPVLVRDRVVGVAARDAAGLAVERGREEQRLAVGRARLDDAVDGGLEAHVEHPVGLVEDEHHDRVQREGAAGEQILEPAGGGDDDVRAGGVLGLGDEADAAVDGGHAQGPGVGDSPDLIGDLRARVPAWGPGSEPAGRGPLDSSRSTSGIPKASVLPDPVGDADEHDHGRREHRRSRSCWTANGSWMPSLGKRR